MRIPLNPMVSVEIPVTGIHKLPVLLVGRIFLTINNFPLPIISQILKPDMKDYRWLLYKEISCLSLFLQIETNGCFKGSQIYLSYRSISKSYLDGCFNGNNPGGCIKLTISLKTKEQGQSPKITNL